MPGLTKAAPDTAQMEQWLAAAKAGSQEAFGQLLLVLRPYLLSVANAEHPASLRSKVGASDMVQETCAEAQRAFANFEGGDVLVLKKWLRGILLHQLQHARRHYAASKRKVEREHSLDGPHASGNKWAEPVSPGPSPSSAVIRGEEDAARQNQLDRLDHALQCLSDELRQVVVLHHQHGWSFRSIADFMNRSESSARRLWQRALDALGESLVTR